MQMGETETVFPSSRLVAAACLWACVGRGIAGLTDGPNACNSDVGSLQQPLDHVKRFVRHRHLLLLSPLLPPPPPPPLALALVQLCECICKMLVNCFRSTKHRSCVEKALAEQGDHRHQPRRQPPGLVQRDRQSHLLQEPAWGSDCIGRAAPDVPWTAD